MAVFVVAGAPWPALLASVALLVLAARRWRSLALVAWAPAAAAVPVTAVLSPTAGLVALGVALACAAWWRVPWERALLPAALGAAVALAVLASPLATTATASDLAIGVQAAALLAGGAVGYAVLTRPQAA